MSDLKQTISDSFVQYAGAVLQSRALVDVRDGLKPSARQIFYALYTDKYHPNKPHKSTLKAIGSMARFYIHGDSSGEGVMMRAAQPFAMRYPLTEVEGGVGNLISSGNWSAPRYTGIRLSNFSMKLFEDIEKETIDEWRDNYDDTEQYPAVLPTKGFYNIVNGSMGIGVGMACSIPQFNLKELNNALCNLLTNPECEFDDIYCAPDFATGAILYNEREVKDSIRDGYGFACKLRSVVDFDSHERAFVVTEIPYGVYTNTICGELEQIIESEENPGIERFNDLTGKQPLIKIYLSKKANPDKVLRYLYKNTSLQSFFSINFTMLDKGRYPRVFTWREMLQAHIDHEKEVYRRGFEFDLHKIESRIHIIDGLLICLAQIEEVVDAIKHSASTAAATISLTTKFLLDEAQAKAVLDMKLARLANLEVKKLENERTDLIAQAAEIRKILESEELFNAELIKGWKDVAARYGDARRTKILQLQENNENEPIETKQLSISISNSGTVYVTESSTLYSQKRNGVGTKFKLDNGDFIIGTLIGKNTDTILYFTNRGNFYHQKLSEYTIGEKAYAAAASSGERIIAAAIVDPKADKRYILFITKNGILKKSELSEYNLKRNVGAAALKLDDGDEIVSVLFVNDEQIGIASTSGQFIIIDTKDVRSIGRTARGVTGMKLNDGDSVCCAQVIESGTTEIASISTDGYIKRTALKEFKVTGRGTKGVKLQNTDSLCGFLALTSAADLLVTSTVSQIRLNINDVPLLSRGTQGVSAIKLTKSAKIVNLSAF